MPQDNPRASVPWLGQGEPPTSVVRAQLEALPTDQLQAISASDGPKRELAAEVLGERSRPATARELARPKVLGILGLLALSGGFYFLVIEPGVVDNVANLQRLFLGATLAAIGAVFIAAEWRPR